jgi:hypothetical protein
MRALQHIAASTLLVLLVMSGAMGSAPPAARAGGGSRPTPEELIPVELNVRSVGRGEIEIVYRGKKAFLPVIQMFTFLRIKCELISDQSLVQGFYLMPDTTYAVDGVNGTIRVGNRTEMLHSDEFIVTEREMYLTPDMFRSAFGLNFIYNPRRIAVTLNPTQRLPAFVERERQRNRNRLLTQRTAPKVEYIMGQDRLLAGAGRLDWRLSSYFNTGIRPTGSYFFRYGGQVLYGDLQLQLSQQVRRDFNIENLRGRQRYAFLGDYPVRQIILGDVIAGSQIPVDVLGIEVTNRPAPKRLLFTKDLFSEYVGPDRTVDAYVGAGIQSFGRTPQDGVYNFEFPLAYGVNGGGVLSYDFWGEEQAIRYRIVVPQEMLPPGDFEYSVITGKLRSFSYKYYGGGSASWGVSSFLTLRSSMEYYDIGSFYRRFYPTIGLTTRLTNSLIGQASVTPFANSRAQLSLILPSAIAASLSYTRFGNNAFFNSRQAINELEAFVTLPFSIRNAYFTFRTTGRQTIYRLARERALQAGFSASFLTFQPGIYTTYSHYDPYSTIRGGFDRWITTVNFDARLRADFILRTLLQFDHKSGKFQFFDAEFGRNFQNVLHFQLFYERNFVISNSIIGVRFSYYFPFARYQAVATKPSEGYTFRQTVSGSMLFSSRTGDLFLQNFPYRVGFGALVVNPYLDLNGNNLRDAEEEIIPSVRINAMTETFSKRLGPLGGGRVGTLAALPYQTYSVYIDRQRLENPLWIPSYNAISVVTEPNYVRSLDFPIVVGGSIRGFVEREIGTGRQPLENITLRLVSITDGTEKSVTTFSSGEYEFVAVRPGKYRLSLVEGELRSRDLRIDIAAREVEIKASADGDIINDFNFVLK